MHYGTHSSFLMLHYSGMVMVEVVAFLSLFLSLITESLPGQVSQVSASVSRYQQVYLGVSRCALVHPGGRCVTLVP